MFGREVDLFLFMGSRCAETAERIFTIYTSYDVFLRKDVPFGGPVVTRANLSGQNPQNPNFGGVNRRFQA